MIREIVNFIAPIQIAFKPVLLFAILFFSYRTVIKGDKVAGLVFYYCLVTIVDQYMQEGIKIFPGLNEGRIYYSEVLWIFLMGQEIFRRKMRHTKNHFWAKILFSFFIITLFLQLFNPNTTTYYALRLFRREIFPQVTAFFLAINGFEKTEDYDRFYRYMIALVIFVLIYMLWQKYRDIEVLKSLLLDKSGIHRAIKHGRNGSHFINPNILGEFIALMLPGYLFLVLKYRKFEVFIVILILLFLLSQTQSRSGVLSCTIGGLLICLGASDKKRMLKYLVLSVFVIMLFMPGFISKITDRFSEDNMEREFSTDTTSRYNTWVQTAQLIFKYPLGIGFGEDNFMRRASEFVLNQDELLDNPHNSHLYIIVIGGFQSFFLWFILLSLYILQSLKTWRKDRDTIVWAMAVGVFSFLFAISFSPSIMVPHVSVLFWLLLGASFSYCTQISNFEVSDNQ